jgi:beta-galactosidase/beta-glucuronidase
MWVRDFPRLKAMGVNTLRIYSWSASADHSAFLDTCLQYGLHVFVTHALGFARDNPVDTVEKQDAIVQSFAAEVASYGDHPAILMWSFGNELNGFWLGFLDDFETAYNCGWNSRQVWDNAGCILSTTPVCIAAQNCIYSKYFGQNHTYIGAATRKDIC